MIELPDIIDDEEKYLVSSVLQSRFVSVLVFDPQTGDAVVLSSRESLDAKPQSLEGGYSQFAKALAESMDERFHAAFTALFSLSSIQQLLTDGHPEIALEYEKSVCGERRWERCCVVPYQSRKGTLYAILSVLDVTASRNALQCAAQDAELYRWALEYDCAASLVIDLETRHILHLKSTEGFQDFFEPVALSKDIIAVAQQVVHVADRKKLLAVCDLTTIKDKLQAEQMLSLDLRLLDKRDAYRWFNVRIIPIGSDCSQILVLIRDLHDEKHLAEEHDMEEQLIHIALRNIYTAVYEIDLASGVPRRLYGGEQRLGKPPEGWTLPQIVRQYIHPEDQEKFLEQFAVHNLRVQLAKGHREITLDFRWLDVQDVYQWVSGIMVPLRNHDSCAFAKVLFLARDISGSKKQEQQKRLLEQYDRVLRNTYDEVYELNLSTGYYRILHRNRNTFASPPECALIEKALHPIAQNFVQSEDRERFLAFFDVERIRHHFASGLDASMQEDFRKLTQDGSYRWAQLLVFSVYSDQDEVYLLFVMDIQERKQAEQVVLQNAILERQRMADERFKAIVKQTDTLDMEWSQNYQYISPEIALRFAGNYNDRTIWRVWEEDRVVYADDMPLFQHFVQQVESGTASTETTVRLRKRDNQYVWCKICVSKLSSESLSERYIGTINDVDEVTRSVLALKYRAEFDTLTGIHNMQTFYFHAEQLLRERREGQYSVIRMDVDRFKVINDLYGLKEGDRLLRTIANILRETLPPGSAYGRLSADIFCMCVALPRESLLALIDTISERLGKYPLQHKVVASFGICPVDSVDTPINVLCDWASLALNTIKGSYLATYAFYDDRLRQRLLKDK